MMVTIGIVMMAAGLIVAAVSIAFLIWVSKYAPPLW